MLDKGVRDWRAPAGCRWRRWLFSSSITGMTVKVVPCTSASEEILSCSSRKPRKRLVPSAPKKSTLTLPRDVFAVIFSCLTVRELGLCSCVCSSWSALSSSDDVWLPYASDTTLLQSLQYLPPSSLPSGQKQRFKTLLAQYEMLVGTKYNEKVKKPRWNLHSSRLAHRRIKTAQRYIAKYKEETSKMQEKARNVQQSLQESNDLALWFADRPFPKFAGD